jgi:hypothetical protein
MTKRVYDRSVGSGARIPLPVVITFCERFLPDGSGCELWYRPATHA